MLEGLPPHRPTILMRLAADEATARRVADLIVETFDLAETAAAAFEDEAATAWEVIAYFREAPDEAGLRALVGSAAGPNAAAAARFERVAERDWVRASLDGLHPVRAGRFLVHGAHDRARARPPLIAVEIEAALAFGTGHHGTTRGCLLMLDAILKRRRPRRVLDLGTGTGVLAIAAARALRRPVAAGDIDPIAVAAARANARHNRAGALVRPVVARGVGHPALRAGRYDLILANILARPLKSLAPALARVAAGDLVLSGLQAGDVAGLRDAYAAQGFRLAGRLDLDGWATLRLNRGGAAPRRRPR